MNKKPRMGRVEGVVLIIAMVVCIAIGIGRARADEPVGEVSHGVGRQL